jgi:Acyl-CoA dehydrogenase, C-terminal domain
VDREAHALFERSLRNAVKDHAGQELDAALEELGWSDAMAVEPRAAISILFGLQGGNNVSSSALGQVMSYGLGLCDRPVSGVVLPAIGRWEPPGTMSIGGLQVNGLAPAALRAQESALVVASAERGAIAVQVPTAKLTLDGVRGIDPSFGLVRVSGSDIATFTDLGPAAPDWASAVALARLAVAHELVGACRKMLELAREHALGRVQFGRPIGSFQAIRHRLADTLVAIEMADAMLDAAWLDGTPNTAAMAKAVAGRQARTTARHCQQVLAGIGFTTEHPLHLSVERTLVLDGMFGSSVSLTRALGEEMVRIAQLPPLLPL